MNRSNANRDDDRGGALVGVELDHPWISREGTFTGQRREADDRGERHGREVEVAGEHSDAVIRHPRGIEGHGASGGDVIRAHPVERDTEVLRVAADVVRDALAAFELRRMVHREPPSTRVLPCSIVDDAGSKLDRCSCEWA